MLARPALPWILRLSVPPEEVRRRFASSMGLVRSILLSLTWSMTEEFAGNTVGDRIQMRVRHRYSNGYAQLLFGRVQPEGSGSVLEIRFRPTRLVTIPLMLGWWALFLFVLVYLARLALDSAGGGSIERETALEMILAPVLVLVVFFVAERIGRHLGKRDEERMRRHVHSLFRDAIRDRAAALMEGKSV